MGTVALLLAGCAPQVESVRTSDGRMGHSINCTFNQETISAGNWGVCYKKAGEMCGARGYDVLQKSDDRSYHSSFNMYGGSAGTINQRVMIIACKGAET